MRKITYILAGLLVMSMTLSFQSCDDARASKGAKKEVTVSISDPYIQTLRDIGLTNVPTVATVEATTMRKMYKEKYGLDFLSTAELNIIVKENNLISGPATNYVGDIPEDALKKLADNYQIYKSKVVPNMVNMYRCPDGRVFDQNYVDKIPEKDADWVTGKDGKGGKLIDPTTVIIVAPKEQFKVAEDEYIDSDNSIQKKPVPKDPLALIQVEGGYIELARWL